MPVLTKNITPERIANATLMDKNFLGYRLFVEGKKDVGLYRKFTSKEDIKIIMTDGKYKMREVWRLLENKEFKNKLAIRDADFIRISGKFSNGYSDNIFITDYHDSECMIINSPTFNVFMQTVLSHEQQQKVNEKFPDLKNHLENLIYRLGCLKLANKTDNLGLTFKPKGISDKRLDFTKFIDAKSMSFRGDNDLITAVINFSINKVKKDSIKPFDVIVDSFNSILSKNHPKSEIIHGHDFSEIIYVLIRKCFKFNINITNDSDNVETLLTMAYDSQYFQNTNLFKSLNAFNLKNSANLFSF